MSDILKEHFSITIGLLTDERQKVVVRRRHVWEDLKRSLSRSTFKECIGLDVTFVGEPAVDVGGPLRELFCLVWQALRQNGNLFAGDENARVLAHNIVALQQNEYEMVGRYSKVSASADYILPIITLQVHFTGFIIWRDCTTLFF